MNKAPYILQISQNRQNWTIYHINKWIGDASLLKIIYSSNSIQGKLYVTEYNSFIWNWKGLRKTNKIYLKRYLTLEKCFSDNFDLFLTTPTVYRNENQ